MDEALEQVKELPEEFNFLGTWLIKKNAQHKKIAQLTAAILINDVKGELVKRKLESKEFFKLKDCWFTPYHLSDLVDMIDRETISRTTGKKVIGAVLDEGVWPSTYVEENDLAQISDPVKLQAIIDDVIAKSANIVEKYKSGKTKVMGSLVGQVMGRTKGKANPKMANDMMKESLNV